MNTPSEPAKGGEMNEMRGELLPEGWHNHEGYRQVFCAALTGICANPGFFGAVHQGDPVSAVEFAKDVLHAARTKSADLPRMPKAVADACELVRADAASTMQHDTTSDLTPRLMCRVDARKLGLLLAWVDQFAALPQHDPEPGQ